MRFQIYPWLIRPTAALPSAFLSLSVQATLALSPPDFHRRVTLLRWYRPPTRWNSPLPEEIVVVVVVVVLVALHPWNSHRFEGLTGQTKLGNLLSFFENDPRVLLFLRFCAAATPTFFYDRGTTSKEEAAIFGTLSMSTRKLRKNKILEEEDARGRFSTEILTEDRSKFGHLRRHTIDFKR